jgi:hypothetical protein
MYRSSENSTRYYLGTVGGRKIQYPIFLIINMQKTIKTPFLVNFVFLAIIALGALAFI